ncbi:MAG: DHA2 family efflux MFS transporter permease subunit, partial [Hyphomicrobiales bacterium]
MLTIGIMAATLMQILDSTIANVALPHMQASLGATSDTITWVLTSYIVAVAVAIPITGWFADRLGSRNLFLGATIGFVLASMLCGLATSLPEMVAFRVLQGIAAAFMSPLSQTAMMDINPPSRQAQAMSVWGMGIMVGPVLGPLIGGWLTENYSWRWVFYVNVPVGAVCIALLWPLLPSRPRSKTAFDAFGFSTLAIAIAALQLMLDRGQTEDWFSSWEVVFEGVVSLCSAWMFVVHQMTAKAPIFDRSLFRDRNLVTGMAFMLITGVVMMATMALLPPMLQTLYGYPVLDAALLLIPRGLGVVISMLLASRLVHRGIDPRILIAVGFILAAFSLWQMTGWTLEMDSSPFVISGFIQGIGMGLLFVPLNITAFATLTPRYRPEGTSLINLVRNMGASIGISAVTSLLAINAQISHADIGSHVTELSLGGIRPSLMPGAGPAGEAAMALLNAEVTRQAVMIAYLDDFMLMAIITALAVPLVLFLQRPRRAA